MRIWCILALLLAGGVPVLGQEDPISLDDVIQAGEQWAKDNLDDNILRSLGAVGHTQVQQLFTNLQARFQGQYVIDLAPLKQAAATVLPILEGYVETQPYAAWLRTRLDYLEVADQFRLTIPAPETEPGQPPKPRPNPGPELERKAWQQQLQRRALPTGAERYAARLKPIFAAQHVPPALVWLAEVESSFDPNTRSPAGAVGLFQLMPATAKSLGLTLRPSDERLEPDKNARAAARYLSTLYGRFSDWPLTLAAYNAGEGNVQRLLVRHKTRTFEGIATHLPAETQMHVPKVEATLLRREGVRLVSLPPPRS